MPFDIYQQKIPILETPTEKPKGPAPPPPPTPRPPKVIAFASSVQMTNGMQYASTQNISTNWKPVDGGWRVDQTTSLAAKGNEAEDFTEDELLKALRKKRAEKGNPLEQTGTKERDLLI